MAKTQVLMVSGQVDKVKSFGGMGRAVLELSSHLRKDADLDVRVLMPSSDYPPHTVNWGKEGNLSVTEVDGVPIYWLQTYQLPTLKGDRPIEPYTSRDEGYAYAQGGLTAKQLSEFGKFGEHIRDVVLPGLKANSGFDPKVVHVHDWVMGLIPFALRQEGYKASVFEVHNAFYDGRVPITQKNFAELKGTLGASDLTFEAFMRRFMWDGAVSVQKIGATSADLCTTVSAEYADYLMRGSDVREPFPVSWGVSNGLDAKLRDYFGNATTLPDVSAIKQATKAILLSEYGIDLAKTASPLIAMVARLEGEKGVERALDVLPYITGATVFIGGPVRDASINTRLFEAKKLYRGTHIIVPKNLSREEVCKVFAAADYFMGLNYGHPEPDGIAAKEALTALAVPILDTRYGSGFNGIERMLNGGKGHPLVYGITIPEFGESVKEYDKLLRETVNGALRYSGHLTEQRARLLELATKWPFPWDGAVQKYADAYGRLIANGPKK